MSTKFAFSEMFDNAENGYPVDALPVGLEKCKEFGIRNVVIEIDLVYYSIDYTRYTKQRICELLEKRIEWIRESLHPDSKIFVNLRDFADAMLTDPERQFYVVNFLSCMKERIFGIAYEEGGNFFLEAISNLRIPLHVRVNPGLNFFF